MGNLRLEKLLVKESTIYDKCYYSCKCVCSAKKRGSYISNTTLTHHQLYSLERVFILPHSRNTHQCITNNYLQATHIHSPVYTRRAVH